MKVFNVLSFDWNVYCSGFSTSHLAFDSVISSFCFWLLSNLCLMLSELYMDFQIISLNFAPRTIQKPFKCWEISPVSRVTSCIIRVDALKKTELRVLTNHFVLLLFRYLLIKQHLGEKALKLFLSRGEIERKLPRKPKKFSHIELILRGKRGNIFAHECKLIKSARFSTIPQAFDVRSANNKLNL